MLDGKNSELGLQGVFVFLFLYTCLSYETHVRVELQDMTPDPCFCNKIPLRYSIESNQSHLLERLICTRVNRVALYSAEILSV